MSTIVRNMIRTMTSSKSTIAVDAITSTNDGPSSTSRAKLRDAWCGHRRVPGVRPVPEATRQGGLVLLVPISDEPVLVSDISAPAAGRRLLSDDLPFADNVAFATGRRIDALRVSHERCDRDMREAEMRRLASEAELSVLRGQLNPHFLFNTLNAIKYLMQVAPGLPQDVLRHVADILRAGLYRSQREHCT